MATAKQASRKLAEALEEPGISSPEEAEEVAASIITMKAEIEDTLQDIENARNALALWMSGQHVAIVTVPEHGKRVSLVSTSRVSWNPAKLREVAEKVAKRRKVKFYSIWQQLTERVPDKDKIEQAVKNGIVKTEDVAPALEQSTSKPYVRITDSNDDPAPPPKSNKPVRKKAR